jgi:hypothetical protein
MDAKFLSAILAVGICFCCAAQGREKASYDAAQEKITDWKKPNDWLELGADFRLRFEYDNARKLDKKATGHERVLFPRLRARAQAKIKLTDELDFNIRLAAEPRYYIKPPSMKHQLIRHEALFDKFNLTWRNAFDRPMTIVIGRQELKLGSGWLIADGTPLDGSRTAFFDAIRFTYNLESSDTVMDFVWIENHGDSAKIFKPFNDRDEDLAEQDERGAIIYFAQKTGEDAGRDFYFIYKQDSKRLINSGSEGEIYTLGAMFYGKLNDNWQYCMEFAPQFGHKNGKSLGAFATNNQLIYNFNDEKNNKIYLGYEYLSGDDDPDRNFDKVFGRIDTWSVLYQGNLDSIDGRAYDNSNMHRLYADWETNLFDKTQLRCGYNLLFADDNTNRGGSGGMSKNGNFRGQLVTVMLKYKASKNLEHRLEGEIFGPGDFYNDDKNDPAVFARYSLYLTW